MFFVVGLCCVTRLSRNLVSRVIVWTGCVAKPKAKQNILVFIEQGNVSEHFVGNPFKVNLDNIYMKVG